MMEAFMKNRKRTGRTRSSAKKSVDTDTGKARSRKRPAKPRSRKNVKPTQDEVRKQAYYRFINRGGTHGFHEDDWYGAEKELKEKKKK
jgi:hypothetical protein